MTDPSAVVPEALVDLDGATLTYSTGVRALEPTRLAVAPGEFVSIIGPSGCGKSTLLRLVAGLLEPTAGTAVRRPEATVAYVFQAPTLMPWADVRRNVRLPLELAGAAPEAAEARVNAALATVGLADFAHAYPRELSGGMQMRVSIARALVTDPRLLLMDEPFGALDEITRADLRAELLLITARTRATVLFVTHSIPEAVLLSDRVLVLGGRPGRLTGNVAIALPRVGRADTEDSPAFGQYTRRVRDLLREA